MHPVWNVDFKLITITAGFNDVRVLGSHWLERTGLAPCDCVRACALHQSSRTLQLQVSPSTISLIPFTLSPIYFTCIFCSHFQLYSETNPHQSCQHLLWGDGHWATWSPPPPLVTGLGPHHHCVYLCYHHHRHSSVVDLPLTHYHHLLTFHDHAGFVIWYYWCNLTFCMILTQIPSCHHLSLIFLKEYFDFGLFSHV